MKKILTAAIAGAAAFCFSTAFANVITVSGSTATITCTGSVEPACLAFTGGSPDGNGDPTAMGTLSSTTADLYDGQPSNEGDEADKLSILVTGSTGLFSSTDGDKNDPPINPLVTFAQYIILKVGNQRVYIYNNTGGALTLSYSGASMLGLSHTTEFGEAIPLPGAIWLMGAGLAGLGFAGRKKKKAA